MSRSAQGSAAAWGGVFGLDLVLLRAASVWGFRDEVIIQGPLAEVIPSATVEMHCCMLINARHAKNLPGRKSDVSDATWLAQLGAHGLVRGSFVPPEPIRHLRDLTRTRTALTRERGREVQRLEKLLEDAGTKRAPRVLGLGAARRDGLPSHS